MNPYIRPSGPANTWASGQPVPVSGLYADQHGKVSHHHAGEEFPACLDREGDEIAFRHLVFDAEATG